MRSTPLHALLLLTLAAALTALGACSGGSPDQPPPSGDDDDGDGPPPVPSDCGTVVEGSWYFDIRSVTGGPILDNATLTQNGCLVFATQGPWRLSGALDGGDAWDVTITHTGETVGHFRGQFQEELESPLFRFLSELDGVLDGVPLVEVVGRFNPGALSIDAMNAFDPPNASIAGGAEVQVKGSGFLDYGLAFVFDGRDALVLEKTDNRTALVRLPIGDEPGAVDVSVLTADEPEGGATASFTLNESFSYSPCLFVTSGAWPLTLDGVAASGSFTQADCFTTLIVDGAEGEPVVSLSGAVDATGMWNLVYLVDDVPEGSGQASFANEPATAFTGTVTTSRGTIAIAGELPAAE